MLVENSEELATVLEDLGGRLGVIEAHLAVATRTPDHRSLAVVAGEGLQGGGTIEKSRALAINFEKLTVGLPKQRKALFPFYHTEEGEHQVCDLEVIVESVIKASNFVEWFRQIHSRLDALEDRMRLLSFYERVEKLEATVEAVVDEQNEQKGRLSDSSLVEG